jgi:hypothetical protein
MKIEKIERRFKVGLKKDIEIKHIANIYLNSDEQVTFFSKKKRQYDFVKKDWGYYATPSINGRLKKFNFLTCLIKNKLTKRFFILVVYKEKINLFRKYIKKEKLKIVGWF